MLHLSNKNTEKEIKPILIPLSCSESLLEELLEPDKLEVLDFISLTASKYHLSEIFKELEVNGLQYQLSTLTGGLPKEQIDIIKKLSFSNKHGDISDKETIPSETLMTNNILPISRIFCNDFSGLILPHHLGARQDLYNSDQFGRLIREFYEANKPICAIGYGVWGLCAPEISQEASYNIHIKKNWCLSGAQLTGISQNEEFRQPYFGKFKLILQDLIEEMGGDFIQFKTDEIACIIFRNLITGPNELSTSLCVHNLCWMCIHS